MRDVVTEYTLAVKRVISTFDDDYYDSLIPGEPQTPAPEVPIGFEQLDPMGTLGTTAKQNTETLAAPP